MKRTWKSATIIAALCGWTVAAASAGDVVEIGADATLDPERTYGAIVVTASDITIDGRGAWIVGEEEGAPNRHKGTGISAKGVSNVVLKNVNVKQWETGLRIVDGTGWRVEGCNFSDNFHDPEFGWGENGRRGGIVLERVSNSVLRRNRANRVWDGCVLVGSNENRLEDNDFSHASNTCLKLWDASRNRIENNVLSHGLRIRPDEVHARDSAGVLIESGSNDNQFVGNDCTHGGDGIFVRVLNGWVSTGNVFKKNDVSYANNNGFEAWSPRNVYIDNKANHCSYGFWLGASDQTRVEGNEASYNGLPDGFHNSPHLPGDGHAGIVFMFGPSSHTVVRGNVCKGNHGAGIALVGDLESAGKTWKAFHWIIEQNRLIGNRWGIYARHADWLDLSSNVYEDNSDADCRLAGDVNRLTQHPDAAKGFKPPVVHLDGPVRAKVGERVEFNAAGSRDPQALPLRYAWDLGDGTVANKEKVSHVFTRPGFHRLGLTVTNGFLSELSWRDLYVVDDREEWGTEGDAESWSWVDPMSRVVFSDDATRLIQGRASLRARVEPYGGGRVSLLYPRSKAAGRSLRGKTRLVFWLRVLNEGVPAWQDVNPVVGLHESDDRSVVLTPKQDLLGQRPNNEEREGWSRFSVPLDGDAVWSRRGPGLSRLDYVTIGFDSWGVPPLEIWIDGLGLE